MTSVLSLTAGTSGGYTHATSALMAAEVEGTVKAIDLNQFTQLAGHDVGALWINDGTAYSYPTVTWSTIKFGSLAYDTGSWTDSNSIGLFRVPNDKWEFVQIGCTFSLHRSNDGALRIITLAGQDISSTHYPYITHNYDLFSSLGQTMTAVVKATSGTVFTAQAYMTGVFSEDTVEDHEGFFIRGYKARG